MADITVQLDNGQTELISATSHHPFWVSDGEKLDQRSKVQEIEAHEHSYSTGRWVHACDLRIGDQFKLFSGRKGKVIATKLQRKQLKVFNFTVENHHNYCVGDSKVLTHNNNSYKRVRRRKKNGQFAKKPRPQPKNARLSRKNQYPSNYWAGTKRKVFDKFTVKSGVNIKEKLKLEVDQVKMILNILILMIKE